MSNFNKQLIAVVGMLLVTMVWGLTFILIKWTIVSVDLFNFLFLRFLIATMIMGILFQKRLRSARLETYKAGLILGTMLTTYYIFQTLGLQYTTASNSSLITGIYMVFIPIFIYLWRSGKPNPFSIAGLALALPGLYLLTGYNFGGINRGDLLTMIVPVVTAWHFILTGEFSKRHPLIPLVVTQFALATFVCGILVAIRGSFTLDIPPIGYLTLAITAIFATCFAFVVQTAAQRVLDPTRAGIIFAMEAVFGALFGWLLGGEVMTVLAFIGATLIIFGMIVSELNPVATAMVKKISHR